MDKALTYLNENSGGIYVLVVIALATVFAFQWLCWIFAWGRFAKDPDVIRTAASDREGSIKYMLTELVVKIINDFRHLLALVIVVIYFLALGFALFAAGQDLEKVSDALQAVTSTLGGLIGAIIGYYFGESAAAKSLEDDVGDPDAEGDLESEQAPSTVTEEIEPAQARPTDGDAVPPADEEGGKNT